MVLALFAAIVFGGLGVAGVDAADAQQAAQDTPVVALGDLHPGTEARIVGIISSTDSPVLWAHWVSTGKSGYWSWSGNGFWLNQGNRSVWVEVGGLIADNAVRSPAESDAQEEWYDSGDAIALYGTASLDGNVTEFNAQMAASTLGGFASVGGYALGYSLVIVAVAMVIVVIVSYVKAVGRVRAHEARMRQPGMYDYTVPSSPAPPPPPPPALPYLPPPPPPP